MRRPLDEINALAPAAFVEAFGAIAEHSPWVAERALALRPFADGAAMIAAFHAVLDRADRDELLALVNLHPDLAGRAMKAGTLTEDSTAEQKGGGLDTLSEAEFERFTALNDRYRATFGFPFIHAMRGGATKHQIIASFEERLSNDAATEFETALAMIKRIIGFRLEDRIA